MGQKAQKRARKQAKATERLAQVATPKQIRRQAKAATRQEFKPLQRQIRKEAQASKLQDKRIDDYFPAYGEAVSKAAQSSQAATQSALDQISGTSKSAADYAETLRQRLASESQADAERRGATYDPSGSETNAAAQLARINSASVLSGVTAGQGAAAQTYFADKKSIGKREQIEQHLREAARRRSLNQDKREIAKDKGTFKVAKLAELRDRERDYLLTQQAAQFDRRSSRQAQRLDRRAQNIDARQTAASQAETRRHNRQSEATAAQNAATSARNANTSRMNAQTSRRAERRQRRQDRFERRNPNAGEEPNREKGEVTKALGILRAAPKGAYTSPEEAYEYLLGKGVSPRAAHAAIRRSTRRQQIDAVNPF